MKLSMCEPHGDLSKKHTMFLLGSFKHSLFGFLVKCSHPPKMGIHSYSALCNCCIAVLQRQNFCHLPLASVARRHGERLFKSRPAGCWKVLRYE